LQVDASRRRNDPRKAICGLLIMVRLRSKSWATDRANGVLGRQASVGSKTRSAAEVRYVQVPVRQSCLTAMTGGVERPRSAIERAWS